MARGRGRWPWWTILAPLLLVGVASARWLASFMPSCLFYRETGLLCPGCGATRAAVALQNGQLRDALQDNALFVSSLFFGGAFVLLAALAERFPESRVLGVFRFRLGILWLTLALLVAFVLVRNLPGFEFLRPSR